MKITSPFLVLLFALLSGTLGAQTTLTVNGNPPTGVNGAVVPVEKGSVMTLVISNPGHAGGRYGFFASDGSDEGADDGDAGGDWWLAAGGSDPFPVITGSPTVALETYLSNSDGVNVDFSPDRSGNPSLVLDDSGNVTLRFRIPESLSVNSINVQAVSMNPAAIEFEYSDGVTLDFSNPQENGARLVVSRDLAGSVDSVEFGVLEFSGNPATGLYTAAAEAELGDVDVLPIALSNINQWQSNSTGGADHADDVDVFRDDRPSVRFDNDSFPRVSLPPIEADGIPGRDLLLCLDNATGNQFFLLINKGDNPNDPGSDFHVIGGSSIAGSYYPNVALSADGKVLFAAVNSGGTTDQVFLFSTDASTPFGGGSSESADITPALGTTVYPGRHVGFTLENVYFVLNDPAGDGEDLDGFSHHLYTASIVSPTPVTNEITIPATGANGVTPDIVGEGSLIGSADGSILVFLAGDVFTTDPVPALQEADWYRVRDTSPVTASNFTQLAFVAEDSSLPKFFLPGEAYDGRTGFASLSPEGRRLAFVAQHHDENGSGGADDDEVYLVSTNGTETAGLLGRPVTINGAFDNVANPDLNNAQDLHLVSDTELLFFYGVNITGHTGDRRMDLYHFDSATMQVTNVTGTSGEAEAPFETRGSVFPEGYFVSPNGRYLYFARGQQVGSDVTLVGVDIPTRTAFNITGDEFGGVSVETTERLGGHSENHAFQLHYSSSANGALVYFAARVTAPVATNGQEVWAFDADFPFGAFRLTDETASITGTTIETLTPDPYSLGAAWAWAQVAGSTESSDLYHLDLVRGFVDLTNDAFPGAAASALAGMAFIEAVNVEGGGGGSAPASLITIAGTTGSDNPTNGVFAYVVLDSNADKDLQLIADTGGTLVTNILQIYHASFD